MVNELRRQGMMWLVRVLLVLVLALIGSVTIVSEATAVSVVTNTANSVAFTCDVMTAVKVDTDELNEGSGQSSRVLGMPERAVVGPADLAPAGAVGGNVRVRAYSVPVCDRQRRSSWLAGRGSDRRVRC
ncbi:hypothetical protein MNBD_ACTINO02-1317 [hydrothermal vent metagenome]|uniref:Uncharacterized protein n=1 Tax=hydrothermal vent metagenome TaxID=652676 RepID=A0A3B0RUP1_9ZZZZ